MRDIIKTISIDIETFSSVDLKKSGVYPYAESPDFEILLFGYAVNGGEVQVVDLACGEEIPAEILLALTDNSVTKWAYNASFERVCLSAWLRRNHPDLFQSYSTPEDSVGDYLDPAGWRCSRVWGAYMGLPLSLKGIGAVLKLDEQKMTEGTDLIRYFCQSCRPTQANGGRTRNLPRHAPEKWALFKAYNKRDVEVELAIQKRLAKFPVPEHVWEEYHLDQEINDRGILLDMPLVEQAIRIDALAKDKLRTQMQAQTGLENPGSVAQMKEWLSGNGVQTESLDKKAVKSLISEHDGTVADVLACRQQLAKSSVSKYQAMQNASCADGRVRGLYQFYGANRSGRWAGRIVQFQNLPQNHMEDLAEARALVQHGDFSELNARYDNIPNVLSELIRTAFIPKAGYKYIVADFSSIEARVLAYLAGEEWKCKAFADGEDIYCSTASRMFGVPVVKHGVNGDLRQKGKIAELACIAERQRVLTNHGLIPIERVTMNDLVWDGEDWVKHDGVIYKGEREVITYEGLTATPDHLVWVEGQSRPIQFGVAAASGAHLLQTGDGGRAIRLGKNHQRGETLEREDEPLLRPDTMHGVWFRAMAGQVQLDKRKVQRMSEMLTAETAPQMAGQTLDCGKTAVRKSKVPPVSELWGERNRVSLQKCDRGGIVSYLYLRTSGTLHGNRSGGQQLELCSGQYTFCDESAELRQPQNYSAFPIRATILALCAECGDQKTLTGNEPRSNHSGRGESCDRKAQELEDHKRTARLYDIRNAGRHHRFTVSGKLVHNCGYGGAAGALKAMGALEMGLAEEELPSLVNNWRQANAAIVQFWWDVDAAVKQAVARKTSVETHGFRIYCESGMLFIDLPSERRLAYVKPKIDTNKFGSTCVTYEGISAGKWTRIESYGPKFVENIVQAVARDILAYAMRTLSHCFICGHVHDELIIECSPAVSLEAVCEQMGRSPAWMPGILLRADGYECEFYKKE